MAAGGAYVGVSGTPQNATNLHVGVSGVWQDCVRGYVGVSGVWEEAFLHLPGQPASFSAVQGSPPDDEADLSWSHHATFDTADSWVIQRAPDVSGSPGTWATIEADWTGGLSYTDTGLDPLTKYWYRVAGKNYQGTGTYSAADDVTTSDVIPDAPSLVAVTQTPSYTDSRLTGDWQYNSDNELGFKVYRNTVNNFGTAVLKETTSAGTESWTDDLDEIEDGTVYYYWVTAYNGEGESSEDGDSNHTELSGITDLNSDPGTNPESEVDLDWSNPSPNNADDILVYSSDDSSSGPWDLEDTISGSAVSYGVTGLADDTQFWFKVVRTNAAAGDGLDSNVVTETTTVGAPGIPQNVGAAALSETSIRISWDAVTDADYYKVYGSTTPSFTPGPGNLLKDNEINSPWDHTGLNQNETWYYRVSAVKTQGPTEGDPSSEVNATTYPTLPQSFDAAEDDPQVDLTWDVGERTGESLVLDVYNWDTTSWNNVANPSAGTESYPNHTPSAAQIHDISGEISYRLKFTTESTYATDSAYFFV